MMASTWSMQAPRALAVAVALLMSGCGTDGDPEGGPPTTSPSTVQPTSAAPSSSPSPTPEMVAVYFLIDTRTGFRLAREWRELPGADRAKAAVEAMIAGPLDPDYSTTWNPESRVLSVGFVGDHIAVDLSHEARQANAGSEVAARMVQQLVYTVTEVLGPTAGVRLLIEGEPAGELWGVLEWSAPMHRERPLDVRMLVQIQSPAEGAATRSPVTVEGDAAAFEASVLWQVLDEAGEAVAEGVAMTTAGQRFAPYRFSVELEPGNYLVVVSEDDPSYGEGEAPMQDTRKISVR